MPFTIVQPLDPTAAHRAAILEPLVDFNERQAGAGEFRILALLIQDASGNTIGGLWGKSTYDWLFVELLVVPDHLRGQGVGTNLMRRAESVALDRNCVGIWLDTFSFQAKPFYQKLGYSVFGELRDHPRGATRFFMQKIIRAGD